MYWEISRGIWSRIFKTQVKRSKCAPQLCNLLLSSNLLSDKENKSAEIEVEHDVLTLAISGDGDLFVIFIQVNFI